jgi:hypothetical protein
MEAFSSAVTSAFSSFMMHSSSLLLPKQKKALPSCQKKKLFQALSCTALPSSSQVQMLVEGSGFRV